MLSFTKLVPLAIVLAALAGDVQAVGCFSGGQSGDCSSVINDFCGGGLTVNANTAVSKCTNVNNYHCDLKIENTSGSSMSISASVCQADLLVTNNGCNGHGGIRQDANFLLTIDPNSGSC